MTDLKDVKPQSDISLAMPDFNNLSKISGSFAIQTDELRKSIRALVDTQNKLFASMAIPSYLEDFSKTINKLMAPTQELIANFLSTTSRLNISISRFQDIDARISLNLKSISSISEIYNNTIKDIDEIKAIQSGSSCLVSMSAEVKEHYNAKNITYENSAEVQIVAEVSDIKEGQKLILEKIARLEEKADRQAIPAKLIDIGFVNNSYSMLKINDIIIQFKGGIASGILHTIFGRKNFNKTRAYEPIDFYEKCESKEWTCVDDGERKRFQKAVYQSIRNINNRFVEATSLGKKLIIQDGNNTYILNPKLFK